MRISSLRARHPLAALLTVLAVLAVPASASALTATIDRPCYSHIPLAKSQPSTQPIITTITGGTPNADFILSATVPGKGLGSAGSVTGTFDAAGNATAQIDDVFPPSGSIDPIRGQRVDLSVADYGTGENPADVPVGSALITNIAVNVSVKPSSPRKARHVAVSGTPFAGKKLYAFITRAGSKRVLRRFFVGTGNVCGYASTRNIVAPPSYRTGHYRLYVNAGKKLNRGRAVAYAFRIYTF